MNIGVIGVGNHAEQSHIAFLAADERCDVTALADLDHARMQAVSDQFGLEARHASDWQEVINDSSIDAVLIMTPDRWHTTQLAAAVAMGKHVFCEKPLADGMGDYKIINGAFAEAAEKGLVVTSCHPRRFDPPFLQARQFLADRAHLAETFGAGGELDLGSVVGFDFKFRYHEPSKTDLHNSLMFDHLNHEIDLANFLFGMSGLRRALKLQDGPIRYEVSGMRDDGIGLTFRGGRGLRSRIYQEDMRIDFERGMLTMDMHDGTATLQYEDGAWRHESPTFKTDYDERFRATNAHFVSAVSGLEENYLTPDELRLNTLAAIALHTSYDAVTVRI